MFSNTPDSINQPLRYYFIWLALGVVAIGMIIFLSLTPNPPDLVDAPFIDKVEHMFAYSILMAWFTQIYATKNIQLFLAIMFCLLGVTLEILQGWGGHRFFEYTDMMANTTGVLFGWWLSSRICVGWLARVDHVLSRQ